MAPLSFLLSGPDGTMTTTGISKGFCDAEAAVAALHRGHVDMIVGALPFDSRQPAALLAPGAVNITKSRPSWPAAALPRVTIADTLPAPAEHGARICAALQQLRTPDHPLQKVVLARALRLVADGVLDPRILVQRLIADDPTVSTYLADLSPAGSRFTGTVIVGASPELLVTRSGVDIGCQPFAGSAPRSADPVIDAAHSAALAESAKDLHEHHLVVEAMRSALEPLCSTVDIGSPQLSCTAAVWHLSTPIRATLRSMSTTALEVALALHPTPAVGGVPTDLAVDVIAQLEGDRGFYAGAVGWCNARGDGRWLVAIRCAHISADRRSVVAQAGSGIVAESDPVDEIAETTTKFATILSALGVSH